MTVRKLTERDEHMVAAFRRERAGYLQRGMQDRADQVAAVLLEQYGVTVAEDEDKTAPGDKTGGPVGRTVAKKSTA